MINPSGIHFCFYFFVWLANFDYYGRREWECLVFEKKMFLGLENDLKLPNLMTKFGRNLRKILKQVR